MKKNVLGFIKRHKVALIVSTVSITIIAIAVSAVVSMTNRKYRAYTYFDTTNEQAIAIGKYSNHGVVTVPGRVFKNGEVQDLKVDITIAKKGKHLTTKYGRRIIATYYKNAKNRDNGAPYAYAVTYEPRPDQYKLYSDLVIKGDGPFSTPSLTVKDHPNHNMVLVKDKSFLDTDGDIALYKKIGLPRVPIKHR